MPRRSDSGFRTLADQTAGTSLFDPSPVPLEGSPRPSGRPLFNGADYLPSRDDSRLLPQQARIRAAMQGGGWYTLGELAVACHAPEASVSAQLRHLRKARHGSHVIERRYLGGGLYQYRMVR